MNNIETIIVALIGIGAALYLLRRGLKTISGDKTDCSCSCDGCCVKKCSEEDE